LVFRRQFSGLVVQVFGNGDVFAHIPSPFIVSKNSRGVITWIPNLSNRRKVSGIVSHNSVRTARYRQIQREFISGVGRKGLKVKYLSIFRPVKQNARMMASTVPSGIFSF
jgi:hypothetical protein